MRPDRACLASRYGDAHVLHDGCTVLCPAHPCCVPPVLGPPVMLHVDRYYSQFTFQPEIDNRSRKLGRSATREAFASRHSIARRGASWPCPCHLMDAVPVCCAPRHVMPGALPQRARGKGSCRASRGCREGIPGGVHLPAHCGDWEAVPSRQGEQVPAQPGGA